MKPKLTFFLAGLILLFVFSGCRKTIDEEKQLTITVSQEAITDTYMAAPLHIVSMAAEAPYYTTGELLAYTQTRQAYEALPSVSYWYTPEPNYGGGGGSSGYTTAAPAIMVDRETQDQRPALNVADYLKCFARLADYGSVCSIQILTDIPVDTDPGTFFDFGDGYPGHAFIQLRKTNGATTVSRTLGFYPLAGWKTLISDGAVAAKFANNQDHEYNAAYGMAVSPAQLKMLIDFITKFSATAKYDIDDYNCTDFALAVFNRVRTTDPLKIVKSTFFGSLKPMNTPQALYTELKRRSLLQPRDHGIIISTTSKRYAPTNTGSCN